MDPNILFKLSKFSPANTLILLTLLVVVINRRNKNNEFLTANKGDLLAVDKSTGDLGSIPAANLTDPLNSLTTISNGLASNFFAGMYGASSSIPNVTGNGSWTNNDGIFTPSHSITSQNNTFYSTGGNTLKTKRNKGTFCNITSTWSPGTGLNQDSVSAMPEAILNGNMNKPGNFRGASFYIQQVDSGTVAQTQKGFRCTGRTHLPSAPLQAPWCAGGVLGQPNCPTSCKWYRDRMKSN